MDVVSIKLNMLYDGLFHAFTWVVTLAGVILLARGLDAEPRRLPVARTLGGAMLVGCGMFNVVEGLIDHQLLGLHHVHPGAGQLAWDIGFIVVSGLLAGIGGLMLVHHGERPAPPRDGTNTPSRDVAPPNVGTRSREAPTTLG